MSTRMKTIACFGATGGCVATALACALKAGHDCTALARSPERLHNLLVAEHKVPPSTVDQRLTIVQGDVKDPAAVSKALISPIDQEALVDVILSGVGAYPTVQWSIRRPFPLTDPTICETAIRTIFAALAELSSTAKPGKPVVKPLLIVVSTAGCGRRRGIPLPIYLQYHYLLGGPLADKKRMEELVMGDKGKHVRDFVVMRPLFLTDGDARGDKGLRTGWEWGTAETASKKNQEVKEPGPEIGYYVSRKDVGTWTFEKVIVQGGWEGKCVYLTY